MQTSRNLFRSFIFFAAATPFVMAGQSGPSPCAWHVFDLRVDSPSISMSGKVDVLFRVSHQEAGEVSVDFGGSAGMQAKKLTSGCDNPAEFETFTADPAGVGEITIDVKDLNGRTRARATTYVPSGKPNPVSITVAIPGKTPEKIDNITWSPNTTIALAMLRAQNANKLKYKTTFDDNFGSLITSCQGFAATSGEYWAIYVNGSYSYFGMDSMVLGPGDEVELRVMGSGSHSAKEQATHQFKLAAAVLKRSR